MFAQQRNSSSKKESRSFFHKNFITAESKPENDECAGCLVLNAADVLAGLEKTGFVPYEPDDDDEEDLSQSAPPSESFAEEDRKIAPEEDLAAARDLLQRTMDSLILQFHIHGKTAEDLKSDLEFLRHAFRDTSTEGHLKMDKREEAVVSASKGITLRIATLSRGGNFFDPQNFSSPKGCESRTATERKRAQDLQEQLRLAAHLSQCTIDLKVQSIEGFVPKSSVSEHSRPHFVCHWEVSQGGHVKRTEKTKPIRISGDGVALFRNEPTKVDVHSADAVLTLMVSSHKTFGTRKVVAKAVFPLSRARAHNSQTPVPLEAVGVAEHHSYDMKSPKAMVTFAVKVDRKQDGAVLEDRAASWPPPVQGYAFNYAHHDVDKLLRVLIPAEHKLPGPDVATRSLQIASEFALWHGIDDKYLAVRALLALSQLLIRTPPSAPHVPDLVDRVQELLRQTDLLHATDLSKEEHEAIERLTDDFGMSLQPRIQIYDDSFSECDPAVLYGLVDIFMTLNLIEDDEVFYHIVSAWIEIGVESKLRQLLTTLVEESEHSTCVARTLVRVCQEIDSMATKDFDVFQHAFPRGFEIMRLASESRWRWLLDATALVCASTPNCADIAVFQLHRSLQKLFSSLNTRFQCVFPRPCNAVFAPSKLAWFKENTKRLIEWVHKAIEADEWNPLSEENLHSTSVQDVYSSIAHAFEFLKTIEAPKMVLMTSFVELVALVGSTYVQLVARHVLSSLEQKHRNKGPRKPSFAPVDMLYSIGANVGKAARQIAFPKGDLTVNLEHKALEGMLSERVKGRWVKSYFVLCSNHLAKLASQESSVAQAVYEIDGAVIEPAEAELKKLWSIKITPDNTAEPIYLAADSSPTMARWMTALQQASLLPPHVFVGVNDIEKLRSSFVDLLNDIENNPSSTEKTCREYEDGDMDNCLCGLYFRFVYRRFNRSIRAQTDLIFDAMTEKLSVGVESHLTCALRAAAKSPVASATEAEEPLLALCTFLDDHIGTVSASLYYENFLKVLRKLWQTIVQTLQNGLLEGPVTTHSAEYGSSVDAFLKYLQDYMHADGDGVRMKLLEQDAATLRRAVELYMKPTRELTQTYATWTKFSDALSRLNAAEEKRTALVQEFVQTGASESDGPIVLAILKLRSGEEKFASRFFSENKKNYRPLSSLKAPNEAEYDDSITPSAPLTTIFTWDDDEKIIAWSTASSDAMLLGSLVLTTQRLLFCPFPPPTETLDSYHHSHTVSVFLKNIEKAALAEIDGIDTGLEIKLMNGKVLRYRGLLDRTSFYFKLCQRTKEFGHIIVSYDEKHIETGTAGLCLDSGAHSSSRTHFLVTAASVQEYFSLSQTEELLGRFPCSRDDARRGYLFFTTSFACFCTMDGNERSILPMAAVESVGKDNRSTNLRLMRLIPAGTRLRHLLRQSESTLVVTTRDSHQTYYHDIVDIDEALQLSQCALKATPVTNNFFWTSLFPSHPRRKSAKVGSDKESTEATIVRKLSKHPTSAPVTPEVTNRATPEVLSRPGVSLTVPVDPDHGKPDAATPSSLAPPPSPSIAKSPAGMLGTVVKGAVSVPVTVAKGAVRGVEAVAKGMGQAAKAGNEQAKNVVDAGHTYVRAILSAESDTTVAKLFNIPDTEKLIARYRAMDRYMRGGRLYVTTKYVGFHSYMITVKPFVMQLEDIVGITTSAGAFQLLDNGIIFTLSDGQEIAYYGLARRSRLVYDVYTQAKALDHDIIVDVS